MAHLSGMQIGNKARMLAAALALGAAVQSLAPGQTAHAARRAATEAGDADTGGGPGRSTGVVQRENTGDDGVRCSITLMDDTISFYLPGQQITINGKQYVCGTDGLWYPARTTSSSPVFPGGGVYAP